MNAAVTPDEVDIESPSDATSEGLSSAEAKRRLDAGLGNRVPDRSSRSLGQILSANVFTLFNAIVFAGFGILLAMGRWQDALFGLPALFNTIIGVVQEFNAKRTLDRLAVLHAPHARVLRDGSPTELALTEVVLGDVLVLQTGDQVTADARVTDTDSDGVNGLELDEALLTGESDAIRKRIGDEVLSGSSVVSGAGFAKVIRVGADSYAAKLTAEARKFSLVRSELRGSIDRLLKWITWALIPMILIVANGQMQSHGGWDVALHNGGWREAIVGAIAAVIAMVPLGLVLITSIAFAASGVALAQRKVLIQELPAVEGLARVDSLCLDKTGTLTSGEMMFDDVHLSEPVTGWECVLGHIGDDPEANGTARCLAEPYGLGESALTLVASVPFNSARKWSAVTVAAAQDDATLAQVTPGTWVLGAPEFVLAHLDQTNETITRTLTDAGRLAESGLRTLLLAYTPASELPLVDPDAEVPEPRLPEDVTPVALVTFREKVRPDAHQTLAYFAEQGVTVRVISGDDPRTVAAVARSVGLECERGFDARELPDDLDELADVLEREHVFGRVTPAQKRAMVHALQRHGHVVAMTGDGVNDALAIKEADLGIAMDTAAQATKAVARLVLLDGRFDRMPGVVAEGRRVIANIERVSKLFLTKTTYAFAIGVIFGALAWSFPFLPRQLSITDGLTIGIPAFFLALMPNASRYRSGFLRRSLAFSIPAGLIVTAGLIALRLIGPAVGEFTTIQAQSASTLVLAGIALWVLAVMARPIHPFRAFVVLAMYAGLALVWIIPFTREFFRVEFLPTPLALTVLAIVACGIVLVELLRAWHLRYTKDPIVVVPEKPRY